MNRLGNRFEPPMNEHTLNNGEPIETKQSMRAMVADFVERCIQCHRCMDVCPVTKGSFSIDQLNKASKEGHEVSFPIREFAFHCIQCGKCVPVCPVNIHRDLMVRYLKFTLRNQKPWSYSRYLLIKGPDVPGMRRIIQRVYIKIKKQSTKDLSRFMETNPMKKADVLFYPGCYIYSAQTTRRTIRLLDYLGCSYTVLGGVTTCCGIPYMLQGEFDRADHCLMQLHQKIKAVDPQIVITACAECFEAVEHIKKTFHERFEVLSVAQYLTRNQEKFPAMKVKEKIVVHDSCRFHGQSPQGSAARNIASVFGEDVELPMDHPSSCCSRWNHGNDPGNTIRQAAYLSVVKTAAPTLACNCLTCYEELIKTHADVEIIDVLQLYEEALDTMQLEEKTQ